MDLVQEVFHSLKERGDAPVCIEPHGDLGRTTWSANDLSARIHELSALFSRHGITAKSRVALFLDNSADFIATFMALAAVGAVAAPVKVDSGSSELEKIISNLQPHALVAEDRALARIEQYRNGRLLFHRKNGAIHVSGTLSQTDETAGEIPDDVVSINYTYRGYGYPLGAMIPGGQYVLGADVFQQGMAGTQCRRMLVFLPMTHIFTLIGCVFVPLLYGMTTVLSPSVHPRRVFQLVQEYKIDFITSVPEVLSLLARFKPPNVDTSTLDIVATGGSTLTAEAYTDIRNTLGVELLHGYGLTEFTPVSRNIRHSARPGTVGVVGDELSVKLDAADSSHEGEILIQSPTMFRGYYRNPLETREAWTDGWFRTGDIGRFDDDHLVFVREKKRTCKVNGVMVDLAEVERAIETHPGVHHAVAALVDGSLQADIVLHTGFEPAQTTSEIRNALKYRISSHKIPKSINQTFRQ